LSTQRSVANQSNTIRIDRLNSTTVKGRKALEAIDASKVTSDKMLVTVDTMLYIRNPIDYMDDITSPDVWN
jgi:prefoldin subunit 5